MMPICSTGNVSAFFGIGFHIPQIGKQHEEQHIMKMPYWEILGMLTWLRFE
jgi:hypothetical protein